MSHHTSMVRELTALANKDGSRGKMIKQSHDNYCPWKCSRTSHISCQPPNNIANMEILYCTETNTTTINDEDSDDDSMDSTSTAPKIAHIENVVDMDDSSVEDIFEETDTESIESTETGTNENPIEIVPDLSYTTVNEQSSKLISFPEKKQKLESGFLCKTCVYENNDKGMTDSTITVKQRTYGIATVIKISCVNNHVVEIVPDMVDDNKTHNTKNFVANYKLLLLMQLLGKGMTGMAIVTALLGIRATLGFYKPWKEMQEKIGDIQTALAKKCCDENLDKEIAATIEKGNADIRDNRVGIVASGDAGWQGAGSRLTYNSISGHTLLVGGYTKLVLAFKFFSKMCKTCDKLAKSLGSNLQPSDIPDHRCAKNWDQSSKAMEPHGIVACAISIWNSGKAWLRVFVSDDDSSSRAALRHSVESRMEIENLLQWPLDAYGKKIKSTGRLPSYIFEPTLFLADPSHRRRVYGKHLYGLKKRCSRFKGSDCEVLIRNFGYAMKQNRGAPMDVFLTAMTAALEHQYNTHWHCGDWCTYVDVPEAEWVAKNEAEDHRLREKGFDIDLYNQARSIHFLFLTDENLAMLNHEFDSQKNEALNKAFTKVAPKNMVFSKTHSLFDRLALVIIYDSIGYLGCLTAILGALLGTTSMKLHPVETSWATQLDRQRLKKKEREKTRKAKGQRSSGKRKRLYSDRKQDARAKKRGDFYKSGSAFTAKPNMEGVAETQNVTVAEQQNIVGRQRNSEPARKRQRKCKVIPPLPVGMAPGTKYCQWCDTWGHERRSFGGCDQNPVVLARKAAEEAASAAKARVTDVPTQG